MNKVTNTTTCFPCWQAWDYSSFPHCSFTADLWTCFLLEKLCSKVILHSISMANFIGRSYARIWNKFPTLLPAVVKIPLQNYRCSFWTRECSSSVSKFVTPPIYNHIFLALNKKGVRSTNEWKEPPPMQNFYFCLFNQKKKV